MTKHRIYAYWLRQQLSAARTGINTQLMCMSANVYKRKTKQNIYSGNFSTHGKQNMRIDVEMESRFSFISLLNAFSAANSQYEMWKLFQQSARYQNNYCHMLSQLPFIQSFWCWLWLIYNVPAKMRTTFVFFPQTQFHFECWNGCLSFPWNTTTLIEIDMLWAIQQLEPHLIECGARYFHFSSLSHSFNLTLTLKSVQYLIWLSFHSRRVYFRSSTGIVCGNVYLWKDHMLRLLSMAWN